jgi:outer membrane protein TolC
MPPLSTAPVRARVAMTVMACALTLAPSCFAAEAGITLEQAQRQALDRSRQLPALEHGVSASRQMAVAAGQLPDPVLKAGIDNLPLSGPERFSLGQESMTMRRVGVMQELTAADKRRLRADRYAREADKTSAERDMASAALLRDTALAWFDHYYAYAESALIAEQAAQARLEVEAADGAYRAGRGSRADLLAARSALLAVEDRTSEAANRLHNAAIMLERWTGTPVQGVPAAAPPTDTVALAHEGLETQLAGHPEISVMTRQQEIAQADVQLAQANKKSDWTVEVAFQQRGSAYSNMISVGLSLPLQWDRKNRQDRELSARISMAEQAKEEREEALRAHVAQVRTLLGEWRTLRERQERYRKQLVPLALDRTQAALAAYRGGGAALAEVLAARGGEIEVRMQALRLDAEHARLWAQLNFLTPATDRNTK